MATWDENGKPVTASSPQSWDENGKPITPTLTQSAGVPGVPKPPLPSGLSSDTSQGDAYLKSHGVDGIKKDTPVQESTPFVGAGSALKSVIPSAVGYATGIAGHAIGLPDWANTGAAIATGMLTHSAGRVITDPAVQDAAMAFNPYRKAVNLGTAIVNNFRGPVQGPDVAPKGFVSPYDTFSKYEAPLTPAPPFQPVSRPDWTPPALERAEPVGRPGAVLPSGSVVGPASPSRINPPESRGNPPRVPQWQRMGIVGQPQAPVPDASPIYPNGGILPSGKVAGPVLVPRSEANPNAVVLNGMPPERGGVSSANADTPKTAQSRVVQSRAKFDENGKRNQLK